MSLTSPRSTPPWVFVKNTAGVYEVDVGKGEGEVDVEEGEVEVEVECSYLW